MITCPNCSATNALGKVFCTSCGAKLPAAGLAHDDMEKIGAMAAKRRLAFKIANIAITAWLALCLLLAIWPHARNLNEQDHGIGAARRGRTKLVQLASAVREGNEQTISIPVEEANAYIRYGILGTVRNRSGSIAVEPDGIHVRWLMRLFNMDVEHVGGFAPIVSLDIKLKWVQRTERLRVASISLGHLPLKGPFRKQAQRLFMGMCRSRQEWALIERLTIAELSEKAITLKTFEEGTSDEKIKSLAGELPLGSRDSTPDSEE